MDCLLHPWSLTIAVLHRWCVQTKDAYSTHFGILVYSCVPLLSLMVDEILP